jgi:hypothetical protein
MVRETGTLLEEQFTFFAVTRPVLKVCHPRCVYQNYSRSMMEGIEVNNTTIFFLI